MNLQTVESRIVSTADAWWALVQDEERRPADSPWRPLATRHREHAQKQLMDLIEARRWMLARLEKTAP